jgi:low temperature requirement protein LtrA
MIRADESRTRWLVLAVMLLGLFMNASVTRAFTTSGWAFVIPLLMIQLGRAVWTLVNSTNAALREHYVRTLIWVKEKSSLPLLRVIDQSVIFRDKKKEGW